MASLDCAIVIVNFIEVKCAPVYDVMMTEQFNFGFKDKWRCK